MGKGRVGRGKRLRPKRNIRIQVVEKKKEEKKKVCKKSLWPGYVQVPTTHVGGYMKQSRTGGTCGVPG